MSELLPHGYQFATKAQWNSCLLSGSGRASQETIRPFAPFVPQAIPTSPSEGAFAPAATPWRQVLWRDLAGTLYRLEDGEKEPRSIVAPAAIARASRIIATRSGLWVPGLQSGTIECFEPETLARRFVVEIPGARVVDVAADRRDGVLALVGLDERWQALPINCAGKKGKATALEGIPEPRELVSLPDRDLIVLLSRDGSSLVALSRKGGRIQARITSATLAPCFEASHIASDGLGRVFVSGVDDMAVPRTHVVVLEALGGVVDDVALSEAVTGLAAGRNALLATGVSGLYVFPATDLVPASAGEVGTLVVTPMLEAPDTEGGRRWLRIEAEASLPSGSSMEIAYAATDDVDLRDEVLRVARDSSIPAARRAQLLRGMGDLWSAPVTFPGSDPTEDETDTTFAAPLHDVRGKYVWVAVSLAAGPGARLPGLSRLSVLYPGRTLMEHLPAIYQREEAQPGSFIRALVGLLETTTQNLDARIAEMGRKIQPARAPVPWLDYVARWLGLPWDDALGDDQKKRIVENAARIARGRGTRAGLEAMLDCLVAGTPRRFRVVDATVDYGLARAGGGECPGSALPAILSGLPATAARLDVQAALGSMRLPCPGETEDDGISRLLGGIRVDVAANAQEREAWEPWLTRLLAEMAPEGTRATVRWTNANGLRGDLLDESLMLEDEQPTLLGADAILGTMRFPRVGSSLRSDGDAELILD